jgi:hypothetical protein
LHFAASKISPKGYEKTPGDGTIQSIRNSDLELDFEGTNTQMDGVGPKRGHSGGSHARQRPVSRAHGPGSQAKQRHAGEKYWLVRSIGKVASKKQHKLWDKFKQTEFAQWPDKSKLHRLYAWLVLILFVTTTITGILQPLIENTVYKVTPASRGILPNPNENLAKLLKYDAKQAAFLYNDGYKPSTDPDALKMLGNGNARFSANFAKDPSKGVKVTDPVNNIDFSLVPKFHLGSGKQDKNQVMYPIGSTDGFLVYTAQTASVKEDILLQSTPSKDKLIYEYELNLADGLEAKLEKNGSVGVYGSSLPLYGNVATGSDKDAELLQKAKQNAEKNKFLFGIPAPVVKEAGKNGASVSARFELKDKRLTLIAENLKQANYPLTIDPSIYIQSAAQLMYGNNESNVEFDVATEQFKKGTTTGARIDEWTDVGNMNDSVYAQGVAAASGYVYRAGGKSGTKVMPYIADRTVTTSSTSVNPLVLNMPAYRPTGDLYIAIIGVSGSTITTPLEWTAFSTIASTKLGAFYHYSTAAEPPSYSFTSNVTQKYAGVILRVKNFDTSNIVNTSSIGVNNQTGTTSMTYPSLTTSAQGTLVIAADGFQTNPANANGYSPPGWADVVSAHSSNTTGDTTEAGIIVSTLDSPPLSGVATGTQTMLAADTGHDSGNFTSTAIAINGISTTEANNQTLQWAHINSTTGSIDSPAPGSDAVACSGWCTNTAYNLPTGSGATDGAGNVGASMVAYNGYLYYIGGKDASNIKSTIYIAKLGANGEPSLWHPSDPDQPDWTYWYKDSGTYSATALQYTGAYAYNGKMYLIGGDTSDASNHTGATANVRYADILPNGTLGTWNNGTNLPTAAYGVSVQGYNGYLYAIGGTNNGTMLATTHYTHLNSDGSMNSWQTAVVDGSTFTTGRAQLGGSMSGIWGGYIYLAGGCSALDGTTDYCASIPQTSQLASINADGTLDVWNTMIGIYSQRFGASFISWQDNLYRFGGCSRQDTSTGTCYGAHLGIQYGAVNQDGDASTVSVTRDVGSGNCQGTDPYDCNLPPVGDATGSVAQGGQMLSSTAIVNGYMYVIGGCASFACNTGAGVSGNVLYVGISSDGKLKQPPSCAYLTYGSWCVDNVNRVNGTTGIAASGITVFGGNIYVVGGLNGSANVGNVWRNSTNSDGSLAGAWSTPQTFTNLGITTAVSYTFVYSRANPSSATYPGNLYIFGGCGASTGAGCTQYQSEVWKCNIKADNSLEETDVNDCDTASQLQIDVEASGGNQGLGIHAGTVYANYIYLVGGVSPGFVDRKQIFYAKFDNSNNVVAISGSSWTQSPVEMNNGRRRGTAFGYNGYLYAVGGYEATVGAPLDTIEFTKINVTDGSLISSNNLFTQSAVTINQRWGLSLAVSNSFAYVIGGCNVGAAPGSCSSFDATVQTFQVYNNDSGAPGGYTTSAQMFSTDRIGASAAVLNGYMYIAGGCTTNTDCGTTTNNVQKAAIDANGAVGAWSNTTANFGVGGNRAYGQLEVAGGTLYYIGGQTGAGTTGQTTIYYGTPSGGAGDITTWSASSASLPQARTQFSSVVWNNRIYVTGGYDTSPTAQTTIYTSPQLNSGGDIPSSPGWTTTGMTGFNVARVGHTAIAYANNLYILGGYTGSNYLSDVQFAQISSSGTVGSWTYTTSLPTGLRQADGFASNGYMYLFGGRSSTNDCTARTLVAPISANTSIDSGNNPTGIGEWYQTNRTFDGGRYGVSAVNYQGKAYVLGGGCQGVVMQDDFDATLDAAQWSNTTGMTAGTTCQSTSTSNVLYMTTGGTTNQAATKDVDVSSGGTIHFKFYSPAADIGGCFAREANLLGGSADNVELQYSTNGGGSWSASIATSAYNVDVDPLARYSVTIPAGAQTASTRFRWIMPNGEANDSFALEDVYIIANGNTTISYPPDRVAQTTLLSQPQIATYSRLVDAGNDAFPKKFLMNGLDNSIGARWQMAYRSMNDTTNTANPCGGSVMTGYGALTNFGDVTLGQPEIYTMKNGAGTDIGCGRYFFMTVSIDASQTYGYPDDITRGPTLDNLTLFYNSNPGKRLLHGKTFTEGIQQPLDTQP